MSHNVLAFLETNRDRLLEKLNGFLAIPSISTDSTHKQDIINAAYFVKKYLDEIGFDIVELQETGGHPLVYAEYNLAGPEAPTVLFYGHYDVQPVDPLELWKSDPFKPEVRGDRLYARSEEHTSELQSRGHLVCRLLLEKKNYKKKTQIH